MSEVLNNPWKVTVAGAEPLTRQPVPLSRLSDAGMATQEAEFSIYYSAILLPNTEAVAPETGEETNDGFPELRFR